MNDPDAIQIGAIAVGLGMAALLGIGAILVVRDTIRRRGRWGMNFQPAKCAQCGEPCPFVRKPASLRQALWGGWTCKQCGFELDKWGRPVAEQPFPAKWSALLADEDGLKGRKSSDGRYRGDGNYRGESHG
jgi:hypothetical protein